MWSQADSLNPLKGRLLSCLSESWHFWVLFVLLLITPCPSMPYCMFSGGCDILWLVCVFFPCPLLLLLCMLGVGSSCMGTDAGNLFLHMNVVGWPGFWINHNLFWTLCAFVLVGSGWVGGRFKVGFFAWLFGFFLIWSKEAETCLEVFQLPVFLFDITCPSILCQPPKGNRKFCLCVSEATSCLNHKDHRERSVCAFKTRWWQGTPIPLVFFLPSVGSFELKTNHRFENRQCQN